MHCGPMQYAMVHDSYSKPLHYSYSIVEKLFKTIPNFNVELFCKLSVAIQLIICEATLSTHTNNEGDS